MLLLTDRSNVTAERICIEIVALLLEHVAETIIAFASPFVDLPSGCQRGGSVLYQPLQDDDCVLCSICALYSSCAPFSGCTTYLYVLLGSSGQSTDLCVEGLIVYTAKA